ncbi:nucleoside phosphorylase domain-containing protein [Aspergillus varians]
MPEHSDYTVGWLCALKPELDAAMAMMEEKPKMCYGSKIDKSIYYLGRISTQNIALTCLPSGLIGMTAAASAAVRMMTTFPSITICLMVGVGGGLASEEADIRLGDVVVSAPHGKYGGVVQYDLGKKTADGFERTGSLNAPPEFLLSLLNTMPSHGHPLGSDSVKGYPGQELDRRYDKSKGSEDDELVVSYPKDRKGTPHVFYGTIASGSTVIKDAGARDTLIQNHKALCVEMEAAGLMNTTFQCLVIRGISNYADEYKNDIWTSYAAAAAAQFAKDLVSNIPTEMDHDDASANTFVSGGVPAKRCRKLLREDPVTPKSSKA